jgi:predicted lipid-binding transport protein (Tim44 family)
MNSPINFVLAAAGGGSGGFGGGGGGGGGFGGGGGGGYAGGGGGISAGFIVLIVLAVLAFFLVSAISTMRYRRRRRARVTATELAAEEAMTDDEDFAPETVRTAAAGLFVDIQRHWSANDIEALEQIVGPDLMVEWRRRLQDFRRKGWQNRCEPLAEPEIEYVGLVNREGDDEDRVVVRITAQLMDYVVDARGDTILKDGETDPRTTLTEWWTLHPPGERWRLLSVESDAEGRHHLASELIAVPWGDDRVRDEALVETAVAEAVPAGVAVSEIAPAVLDADARSAALDLALADGRFAPDVLEVAARRAVQAWVEAVDGAAIDVLLYGGDATRRTRVVVRGARVEALAIDALDPTTTPATMTAAVTLRGRTYVEDRDTADVVGGSKTTERKTVQRWTFALTDAAVTPWRLARVA